MRAAIAVIALLLGACTPSTRTETSAPQTGGTGPDTLALGVGQSARTRDAATTITFVRLLSDSRCNRNVVCVWQGDAAVRLKAVSSSGTIEATIHTGIEPRTITLGDRAISILDVSPYPGSADSTASPRVTVLVAPAPK